MRIYLIRHADPDYDNNTITPKGHLEARALAEKLKSEGLSVICSSPMGRAQDTAKYTLDATGLKAATEDWTAEFQDFRVDVEPWGSLAGWQVPGEVIRGTAPIPVMKDPLISETVQKMRRASDAFLARHGYVRDGGRYRIERQNQEKIAVFCHNGFGLTWLAHLLELPPPLVWTGFWLPPSSVTTILFEERSAQWAVPRCIGLGDVSHLHAAGLPVQPRGIRGNFF